MRSVEDPVESSERRTPGRPRSALAHRAILDAAIQLFVEEGFGAMSMEGVAARAGVGKTTIYRRWDSKEDLVVDAIEEIIIPVPVPDTGSLRGDLIELLVALQRSMRHSVVGQVFPRMAQEVAAGSALGVVYRERILEPRTRMVDAVLHRGIERGELPVRADIELASDLLIGPIILCKLTQRLSDRTSRQRATAIVDTVLFGLRRTQPVGDP
jgi:AcrR family transcriptional regulator